MKRTWGYWLLRSASACGYAAVLCGIVAATSLQASGQDASQNQPVNPGQSATTVPSVQPIHPIQEFNPVQVVKPIAPTTPDTVNTTGGIINSHPQDIFNQTNTFQPPPQPSETIQTYRVEDVVEAQPNLTEMNSNAGSIHNHDWWHGPFNLAVQADSVISSNLFNDYTGVKPVAGEYFDLAVPVGLSFKSPTTNFGAYFRESSTFYPSYSNLNHTSEIYSQDLQHKSSDITNWDWSVAGGRIVALNEYLPTFISVGTTGVVQNTTSNGLVPMYNAASTLTATHRLDDRDTLIASGTAGWTQEPLSNGTTTQAAILSREAVGAVDVQLQRALNPFQALGVELTNIYVDGLSPSGDSNFTSVKLTFQQAISQHGSLRMGAGPLYSHAASSMYPTQNNYSYTANFGIDYQTSFARMSAGYARIFQLGYLAPATAAHQLYAVFDRPITRAMNLTIDTSYFRAIASGNDGGANYSSLGFTSQLGYNITPSLTAFVSGAIFRQSVAPEGNINQNSITTGFTYTFGNPLSRTGAR